jgi:site-specific DNA-methyltransferase (adenine-specific)
MSKPTAQVAEHVGRNMANLEFIVAPENQIIKGNSLEIMKRLPDKSVNLILTDPPYGLNYGYNSYVDTKENLCDLIAGFMPEALRISNLVAVTCGITPMHLYPQPDWIMACVWDTTGSHGMFGFTQWFPILMYGKDIAGFGSVNGLLKSDVIKVTGGAGVGFMRDAIVKNHPCPKPLNLIKYLVRRLSFVGDLVFDPFSGSGTTAIACLETERRFLGIEIDDEYHALSLRRIEEATAQQNLFGTGAKNNAEICHTSPNSASMQVALDI